jgi:hypothetical protein
LLREGGVFWRILLIRKRRDDTILKTGESLQGRRIPV